MLRTTTSAAIDAKLSASIDEPSIPAKSHGMPRHHRSTSCSEASAGSTGEQSATTAKAICSVSTTKGSGSALSASLFTISICTSTT